MSVNIPIVADPNSGSFESIKRYLEQIARAAGLSEKEIADMNKQIDEGGKKSKQATENTTKGINSIKDVTKAAGQALLATFSVQLLVSFQKHIFNVTSEFQKMEAILTNTLGSQSAAQLAMSQIMDFASKTPFAVGELTESFIKLTNQGFKPSMTEMRKLGDLASSTGKSFDMLAEAIIDAQVGEFERLKEFGIRAQKEGDKVTFTFKGVQKQVEYTEKAMRNYILSLGDVEGVSGAMAAISETVSGKVSNLGDNVDQLAKAIGDKQTGVYAATLDWLNDFLSLATLAVQSAADLREQVRLMNGAESFEATNREVDLLVEKLSKTMSVQEAINRAVDLTKESYANLSDNIDGTSITGGKINKQLSELELYRAKLIEAAAEEEKRDEKALTAAQKKAAEEAKRIAALGIIGKLEHEISEIQKTRNNAGSVAEIALIDARIAKRREEIALIELMAGGISAETENPFAGSMGKATEDAVKRQKKAFDDSIKNATQWMEKTQNITKDVKDFWRDWADQVSWAALDTYMNIEELGRMNTETEIARLDEEKERRLALAGDDKDQQILIEEEFEAKKEEIRAKERARMIREAIAQRALSVFNIIRNTKEAAIAMLTAPPIGLGPVYGAGPAAGIVVLGAIQAAQVATAPLPKFAKGVYNLEGPGSDTSDSVHAMLSRGESVVPAGKSRMFRDVVQPMIEDQHFNYEKLLGIAMDKVNPQLRGELFRTVKTPTGDIKMLQEMQALRRELRGRKGVEITIDQNGVRMGRGSRQRFQNHIDSFLYD